MVADMPSKCNTVALPLMLGGEGDKVAFQYYFYTAKMSVHVYAAKSPFDIRASCLTPMTNV